MYKKIFKRYFDLTGGILLFILILPIFLLQVLLLLITNKGKVFFIQKRPGKFGRIFKIVKFKTMNDKKDKNGEFLSDEKRLTSVGKVIRKFSLDEIPQLINVIKGDMSFIGPRPLLPEYLTLYNDFQKRRHDVKPGITGWAQVNGRNAISWDKRFKLDLWYIENISFYLDLKILLLTIKKVFKTEGISSESSETMEKFAG